MEPMLTVEEVAKYLKVTSRSIYNWLEEGKIVGTRVGSQWRIAESDLQKFIKAGRNSY